VGARARGHRGAAVAERAPVRRVPVLARVAENLTAVELVEPEGALARGEPHRAGAEQLLELLHHAEHAYALVLVDVVEVADRDDPLGRDLVVVGPHALGHTRLAEVPGGLRPHAREAREPEVGRRRGGRVGTLPPRELPLDLP